MNVPNHERKAFRDMTPEERSAIVEAWIRGDAVEVFNCLSEKWIDFVAFFGISGAHIYRTRPRQLVIPWEHIKPEYKWAAMDDNGYVYMFNEMPNMDEGGGLWSCDEDGGAATTTLNINTTGIDWRESLTARPEGCEMHQRQDDLMLFDPATGEEKPYPSHSDQYRIYHGQFAWLYNPWTGPAERCKRYWQ